MRRLKAFILDHFEGALIALILIGILAIAFLVHYKFSFLNFFFLPVILSGYYLGKKEAVLTGICCVLLVIFYLIFFNLISGQKVPFSFDEIIHLLAWGSFLILTAAIVGQLSEQRESKLINMRKAYIGVLEIMLKYLEVADEQKPPTLRVSLLAGKIARIVGLRTSEVENIKSAALLYDAGDLRASIPLFEEVVDFTQSDMKVSETPLGNRERIMLKTTASLLKEIAPLLFGYFQHYVEEGVQLNKDLKEIPMGSSIIALADLYDKISTQGSARQGELELRSLDDIEKLAGKTFPSTAVQALKHAIQAS